MIPAPRYEPESERERFVRLTWGGLYVGRVGISLPGLVLIIVIAGVLLFTSDWWKALLVLFFIPLTLAYAWSERKMGARTCPRCGGSGRVWPAPVHREEGKG